MKRGDGKNAMKNKWREEKEEKNEEEEESYGYKNYVNGCFWERGRVFKVRTGEVM